MNGSNGLSRNNFSVSFTCVCSRVFAYCECTHTCGGLKLASGIFLVCFPFYLLKQGPYTTGSLEFVGTAGQAGSASRVLEGRELPDLLSFPKLWSSALVSKNHIRRVFSPTSRSAVLWDGAHYFLASLSTLLTQVPESFVRAREGGRRENTSSERQGVLASALVSSSRGSAHRWPQGTLPREELSLRHTLKCARGKILSLNGGSLAQLK